LLNIDGIIGPASQDYLQRSFKKAVDQNAQIIIIQMNTPGGLDTSMRKIIQDIIASPIPIVSFVSPSGARAASAGTYILYASHIAAMAPATNLGAATPVQIKAFSSDDSFEKQAQNKDELTDQPKDHLASKLINDAVAYIRGLAQMHGRNAEWAEKAVREADSLNAEEALAKNVIDVLATDISDLLSQIDGRTVTVLGQAQTLSTEKLIVQRIEPDWRTQLLAIITNPNVAYILMLLGIYALIFEFANPGMILPGVAGAICLLLALFAFQVLPINYAGLALILLGIAFMVGEVFVASFGALGIGGVIAFVIGSIMLLDTGVQGYGISMLLIASFALLTTAFFIFVLGMVFKARQQPVVSGVEQLIDSIGEVQADFDNEGWIRVHSELWQAQTSIPLKRGQKVQIIALNGLALMVKPYPDRPLHTKEN
jgi:membrane-bound serine protease (ClpP class)